MKIDKFTGISIRVIILFSTAIILSFVPDYLHEFFGDTWCTGSGEWLSYGVHANCNYGDLGYHDAMWHWGYRHWLYCVMTVILFIIQAVRIIIYIDKD